MKWAKAIPPASLLIAMRALQWWCQALVLKLLPCQCIEALGLCPSLAVMGQAGGQVTGSGFDPVRVQSAGLYDLRCCCRVASRDCHCIWILATYDIVRHVRYRASRRTTSYVKCRMSYAISYIRYCIYDIARLVVRYWMYCIVRLYDIVCQLHYIVGQTYDIVSHHENISYMI
jgi:hypothetical protein